MKRLLKGADHWMFGLGSPLTLGVFRAMTGTLVFASLAMVLPFFEDWYTERGFVPAALNDRYLGTHIDVYGWLMPRLNVLAGATDSNAALAIYLALMFSAALMALGLFSRVATVLVAIGLVSLHHRNALILHGGDTMMRMSVLYLALAPSGAAFSLDRWIALRRGKAPPQPRLVSLWPQRLIQIQVAIVYFTTVWHKWGGHYWRDGSAVWYPMRLNEFDRFPLPDWIYSRPAVWVASFGTLLTELALATLVFYKPFRKWVLLAAIGMHLFIEYAFNIPLFAFLMMSTYVTFYEGSEIAAWWDRVRARLRRWGRAEAGEVESAHV